MSNHDREEVSIRVIDAITTDLVNNGDFNPPPTNVVKYRFPLIVMPEECPLLNVALQQKPFVPMTTNKFNSAIFIQITWWEEAVAQVKTLIEDPELARGMLRAMGKIERRIRLLANNDWEIPEAWQVLPQLVEYQPPPDTSAGAVEGYAMSVRVDVDQESV